MTMNRPSLREIAARYQTDKGTAHSYDEVYEDLFAPIRDTARHVLEVGIDRGGSLLLWQDYFPNAFIDGLDIDPRRVRRFDGRIICDCGDSRFFQYPRDRYDLIIDDGDHDIYCQAATFKNLYYSLKPGSLYIVEDVQDIDGIAPMWRNLYYEPSVIGDARPVKDVTERDLANLVALFGETPEVVDLRLRKPQFDNVLLVFRKPV